MKIRVPMYFKEFKCIASQCEDTCCAGWGIVIDEETYNYYKKIDGEFGERLRSEIVNDGEENIFKLKGKNCPFLNKDKLCDIYKEIGEEGLCYTCKQYPRFLEEFGGLREIGIALSCPEAARIILKDNKKIEFELTETYEEISSYNDINPILFIELMKCRKFIIDIIQNPEIDINISLSIVLKFVKQLQDKIDLNEINKLNSILNKYLDKKYINEIIGTLEQYSNKEGDRYNNIHEYFTVLKGLKHINSNDPLNLSNALLYFEGNNEKKEIYLNKYNKFNVYYQDKLYKFRNLIIYFIYRYFMKAVFDYDVSAKIKTAVISYLIIKELSIIRWIENNYLNDEDIVSISQTYSKDIEHLEENIEILAEIFETNNLFKVDEIITVLMN